MQLQPMSPDHYAVYFEQLVVDYADDKVRAGNWPADSALERSRDEITKLLPNGPSTPNHALFYLTVPDQEAPVGILWLSTVGDAGLRQAFIYDLWIRPDLRGGGLGKQAMTEAEAWARSHGLDRLSLHVFGHNTLALELYKKLGYVMTNVNMTKRLA
jgi:ribosomal protein S18 acetylase RimI-like enzyme